MLNPHGHQAEEAGLIQWGVEPPVEDCGQVGEDPTLKEKL